MNKDTEKSEKLLAKDEGDEGVKLREWYSLDNAGQVYIPSKTKTWTATFRISAVFKEKINPEVLKNALSDIMPRFPTINAELRAGWFWYYFQEANEVANVCEEKSFPQQKMLIKSRTKLYRVLYFGNRISFEVFHAVTDGGGAMVFLRTLCHRYLSLLGIKIDDFKGCLDYRDYPTEEEKEDSFKRVADMKSFRSRKESAAYRLKEPLEMEGIFNVIHGEMSLNALKTEAKKRDLSVGEFLAGCLMYSAHTYIRHNCRNPEKLALPLALVVPIDLRRRLGSKTLRNFSSYINVRAPLDKEQTLDEIFAIVKERLRGINEQFILENINTNIASETNMLIRILPLFVKNIGMKIGYKLFSEKVSTFSFSNFMTADGPKAFENHILRFESMLGPPKVSSFVVSCVSFADKTVVTFSSRAKNPSIERVFFRTLADLGLNVTIDSNRREAMGYAPRPM